MNNLFNNTENAFSLLHKKQLRFAYVLFWFITKAWLVRIGKLNFFIAKTLRIPYSWAIKPTLFRHFCGGETIAECRQTISQLASARVNTILDYSAEGLEDNSTFDTVRDTVLETIYEAKTNQYISFGVFKFTGLCYFSLLERKSQNTHLTEHDEEHWKSAVSRAENIFEEASKQQLPVFADAEETWIQPAIDEMLQQMMLRYNRQNPIVYTTLQMYRTDSLLKLKKLIDFAQENNIVAGVKLVRGAYMEKERNRAVKLGYTSPIQPDKVSTDEAYDAAVALCLSHLDKIHVCIATHNEESCYSAIELIEELHLEKNDKRIWFSQLYGMSDHISFNLSAAGYNVCKYVPFGSVEKVLPYLIRRAEENSSVTSQSNRELKNIRTELKRRKSETM